MLLKDCPVGSVVRLVSYRGNKEYTLTWWKGLFTVEDGIDGKFIIDRCGAIRGEEDHLDEYQFEIVCPYSSPRITFTVGVQEFYVGQRVWSLVEAYAGQYEVNPGDEMEVSALSAIKGQIVCRHVKTNVGAFCWLSDISTTPPAPNEWKRGDWARHEDGRIAFVCGAAKLHGEFGPTSLMVSFENEAITNIPASEFTFISHSEPPE